MKYIKNILIVTSVYFLFACTTAPYDLNNMPSDIALTVSEETLDELPIAVYIPGDKADFYYFKRNSRYKVELGSMYQQVVMEVGKNLFRDVTLVEADTYKESGKNFSLLVIVRPSWKWVEGSGQITIEYLVRDKDGIEVLNETHIQSEKPGNVGEELAYQNATIRGVQYMFADIVNSLKPSAQTFPATGKISKLSPRDLASMEKPAKRITGTKINGEGALISIMANLNHCLLLNTEINGKTIPINLIKLERILDLALLQADTAFEDAVFFETVDRIKTGKPIVSAGYSLISKEQKVKLSFGNINDDEGLEGGFGIFQYASAVKPPFTGGPVLDNTGILHGYNAGSYANTKYLVDRGHISENVYFALKSEHIKQFLDYNNVAYHYAPEVLEKQTDLAEIAGRLILPINCYQ